MAKDHPDRKRNGRPQEEIDKLSMKVIKKQVKVFTRREIAAYIKQGGMSSRY